MFISGILITVPSLQRYSFKLVDVLTSSDLGTVVSEVNRVLKQYQQMNAMMKKMSKLQGSGMPGNLSGGLGDFQGLNNLINKNLN